MDMLSNTYGYPWPLVVFVWDDIHTTVRGTITTLQIVDVSMHQKT